MADIVTSKIRPIAPLGNAVVCAVWISIGLQLVKTVLLLVQTTLHSQQLASLSVLALWASAVGYYGAGIVGLVWMQRAYNNLAAAGMSGFKYMPTWIFWGWVIPISNWVMPYRVTTELWEASGADDAKSPLIKSSGLGRLKLWWACWLVSGLVMLLISLSRVVQQAWLAQLGLVAHVVALVLAAHYWTEIVADINHRQLHKFPELQGLMAGETAAVPVIGKDETPPA